MARQAAKPSRKDAQKPPLGQFIFLDDTRYDIPGEKVTILGSFFFDPSPLMDHTIAQFDSSAFLSKTIKAIKDEDPDRAIVVLTHLFSDDDENAHCLILGPLESSNVKLWAFGKSLHNIDREEKPGKRIYSNQRGPWSRRLPDFDVDRVVEVTAPE